MISKIIFNDHTDIALSWWKEDLVNLHKLKQLEFTDGLNFIVGPNGYGKSSIIKLLCKHLMIDGGTYSKLNHWCKLEFQRNILDDEFHKGSVVKHDGQQTFCFDSSESAGLQSGEFNDTYFSDGVISSMINNNNSAGQRTIMRFAEMMKKAKKPKKWYTKNDLKNPIYNYLLTPSIPKSKITILLDEPTSSFYYDLESTFIKQLPIFSTKFQVICATHSIFAFQKLKNVNIIDLKPGYYEETREKFKKLKF